MIDFDFISPTKIYFGSNKEELIGQICKERDYKRVYIVIGQGSVKRNGLLDRVLESLNKEGIKYQVLEGVRPNPTIDLCHKGIEEAIALILIYTKPNQRKLYQLVLFSPLQRQVVNYLIPVLFKMMLAKLKKDSMMI